MFLDSLEPTDEEWAGYRSRVLGRRAECPSLSSLYAFAMRRCSDAQQERMIEQHYLECGYCQVCVAGFRKGANAKEPDIRLPDRGRCWKESVMPRTRRSTSLGLGRRHP